MARIRAVLVGVEVFERPDIPRLNGCVNDVLLVRRVLKEICGVPNRDIRLVVNERATKDAIIHRVRKTIHAADEGDIVVFYYSGHGSQIRDRDGDELSDRLDELLVPYDMDWDRGTYISDDEIDELFREVRPGVLLEAFFDCCFFGVGPEGLYAPLPPAARRDDVRFLVPPLDIACRTEGDEEWLAGHGFRECGCFADRNVLWSATAEGQEAVEDDFAGRTHGVFTYWGCRFIEDNAERILAGEYSREQLLADLHAYLRSLGYVQSAELNAPRRLLSVGPFEDALEQPRWMPARRSAPLWTRRAPARPHV